MPNFTPGLCANCDRPTVTAKQPLFCSQQCRQAAELVRYVRSVTRDGRIAQPEVREAVQMRTAMVLGGGYGEQERQVPDKVRALVFERSGGRCENCRRELDFQRSPSDRDAWPEIHHARGDSNDPADLRAWCRHCNMGDAQAKFTNVEPGSPQAKLADELRRRWEAPSPLRVCDDEQRWASIWRQLAHDARVNMKSI